MVNSNEKFFSLTGNLFEFDSCACDCVVDIVNTSPGKVEKTVKVQGLPQKSLRFAFTPDRGMVRLAATGAIDSDRILTKLLSLPDKNEEKLFAFFSEYGFLFPIRTDDYEAIDLTALWDVINRIRSVVFLMSEISASRKNYEKILGLVMYLQLSQPTSLNLSGFGERPFLTCPHPLFQELEQASLITEIDGTKEAYSNDTYAIADTIYSPIFQLNIEQYNDTVNGFMQLIPGASQSQQYKNITRLYRNAPNLSHNIRLMIDFLYHYQTDVGIISNFGADGKLNYYDSDLNVRRQYNANFKDVMKNALIEIAKITIKEELDYNTEGVLPRYDIKSMAPSWAITDILSGLYFSIFYMRPGIELYRKCANPNCDRWFLVKTTSERRKYCEQSCSNSVAQRNHRKRKKENAGK